MFCGNGGVQSHWWTQAVLLFKWPPACHSECYLQPVIGRLAACFRHAEVSSKMSCYNKRHILGQKIFCIPMNFYTPNYGANVLISLKKNTKFRWEVTIQNFKTSCRVKQWGSHTFWFACKYLLSCRLASHLMLSLLSHTRRHLLSPPLCLLFVEISS